VELDRLRKKAIERGILTVLTLLMHSSNLTDNEPIKKLLKEKALNYLDLTDLNYHVLTIEELAKNISTQGTINLVKTTSEPEEEKAREESSYTTTAGTWSEMEKENSEGLKNNEKSIDFKSGMESVDISRED
jgi:sensor domain CHASE-containing protein